MVELRWENEMQQAMELIYRLQVDHRGRLEESTAIAELGDWVSDAAERAQRLSWLVAKGSPTVLVVTYGGRKALDAAIASRNAVPAPHWLGGSIVSVESPTGPVLPPHSYKHYEELKRWALEHGVLKEEDIEKVASASRREPEEPEEYRTLEAQQVLFPGTRGFAVALEYEEKHPLGGGMLSPEGYEGAYEVTATLTRQGSPNVPSVYVTDPNMMEGDSHIRLPEVRREDGTTGPLYVTYSWSEEEEKRFELQPNRQGRLGQIRTVTRARSIDDARHEAVRLLNPFLCDLSYRQDVPIEVLQMNVVELATLTMSGVKEDDFREQLFDPEQFLGPGLAYELLPNYEFFTRLYRDGVNSRSVDYGFLCFFRIAEGIVFLRRKRIAKEQGRSWKKVRWAEAFEDDEIIKGEEAEVAFALTPELLGESLLAAYERLNGDRVKVAHAFLDEEDPLEGHADIIAERLEAEKHAGSRRAQARYMARRLMDSLYFYSNESAEDSEE